MRNLMILLALMAPGAALAGPAEDVLARAAADCAAFENGVFTAAEDAVQAVDLTGDGVPETVVDAGKFQCSSAASLYGGSGGTWLTVVVDGKGQDFLAQAWTVTDFAGSKVLVLYHNGGDCGGIAVAPCGEALVWGDGRFMSVRPGG